MGGCGLSATADSSPAVFRLRVAPRPRRAEHRWRTCPAKRPRRITKSSSARKRFRTSACRPSMSSTRRAPSLSLAIRSPSVDAAVVGVAAVAAVVAVAAAVAAGEVAVVVAAAAVAAACHGDVAPSAKRHTTFKSPGRQSPSQHCATGRGPTVLAVPTERGQLVFVPTLSASQ